MKASQNSAVDERTLYGGQAVVEGVMMRSPRYFAVACRRQSNGEIVIRQENVESMMAKWQWLNKPFLRGTLALVDAMAMGIKALTYAANVQAADELGQPIPAEPSEKGAAAVSGKNGSTPAAAGAKEETAEQVVAKPINDIAIGGTMVLAMLLGIFLFWELPTLITQGIQALLHIKHPTVEQSVLFNLGDGVIRIVFFLCYVLLISAMPHVRRVFQYHGAEHKAINALEAGRPLTLESARESSRIHPRCGTNFIFLVLIVFLIVAALFGRPPIWERLPLNLVLLPFVAGISFEILKFAGNHRDKKWAQWLVAPGLATQYLTTRVPDDSQIEVALAALVSVWDKEHEVAQSSPAPLTEEEAEPAAAVA